MPTRPASRLSFIARYLTVWIFAAPATGRCFDLQRLFCRPFVRSEDFVDQDRSVALAARLWAAARALAEHHRDIVRRCGRCAHSNAILDRESTTINF